MRTRHALRSFAVASMLLAGLAGCTMTTAGSETEAALSEAWQDALPTRSRADTTQTQAEVGALYDVFSAACPGLPLFDG